MLLEIIIKNDRNWDWENTFRNVTVELFISRRSILINFNPKENYICILQHRMAIYFHDIGPILFLTREGKLLIIIGCCSNDLGHFGIFCLTFLILGKCLGNSVKLTFFWEFLFNTPPATTINVYFLCERTAAIYYA